MKSKIAAGTLAGIACAIILAGFDCNFLVFDTGGFWLRFGPTLLAFLLYLPIGALAGAASGLVWSLLRKSPTNDNTCLYKSVTIFLTFVSLVGFGCFYLYDCGLGQNERGKLWHYLIMIPVSLLVSVCLWQVIKILIYLHGKTRYRLLGSTIALLIIVLVEVSLAKNLYPGIIGSGPEVQPSRKSLPNILLLVMDTTRRDALSCYGHPDDTTPFLDRIAADGLLFTRAYAPGSWTPPSHASMFTGLYLSEHGTHSNQIYLKQDYPVIAEVLSDAGYETFFLSYKGILRKSHGWDRGFHHGVTVNVEDKVAFLYRRLWDKFVLKDVSATVVTTEIAIKWLESRDSARPYFLFMNVSDPHSRYVPREPFFSRCSEGIDFSKVDQRKVHYLVRNEKTLARYNKGEIQVSETEFDYVRCIYDSEANFQDKYIGRLFEKLAILDDERRTVAIVTSDHGEMLGEHGATSHGQYLYNELIHIPLIIWGLNETGRVDDLVSLVDIFPTIMDMVGISEEYKSTNGNASLIRPRKTRKIFAECWVKDVSRKSLVSDELKFIWESTGQQYLFDVNADPGEIRNMADGKPEVVQALLQELAERFDLSLSGVGVNEIDEESMEILKSLGYVH